MTRSENTVYDVSYGDVTTAVNKLFQQLGKAGATVAEQMKSNPNFVRRLAKYAIAGTYGLPTKVERAQEIMGVNFIGMDTVSQLLGWSYSPAEGLAMSIVPYPEEVLLACAQTHILVPGADLTIDEMYKRTNGRLPYVWSPQTWCWKGAYASMEKVGVQWYLIRKGSVPESMGISWNEQCTLLSYNEIVPRACEVFYAATLNILVNGEHQFVPSRQSSPYVRCSDVGRKPWFRKAGRAIVWLHSLGYVNPQNDVSEKGDDDVGIASRWRLPSEI